MQRKLVVARRSPGRDTALTPSMGPLILYAVGAVVIAVSGAVALYVFLAWLLGIAPHPERATSDEQKLLADLVKIALGLAAGIGAAVALIVGYRRARVEEAGSHRDDRRLFSSRYQDAAELIGHDKAAVRLAGIYAMSRLADDWNEQRQQCIDVLCAYLRLPYDPTANENGEREVRLTLIRIITNHLRDTAPRSWQGHDFDFTGATFDGGDFSEAVFSGGRVDFTSASFTGDAVIFMSTLFSGGTVTFNAATFSGADVYFAGAVFDGGEVDFDAADFASGEVTFYDTDFISGAVSFKQARFTGGTVSFGKATFRGGDVGFYYAEFTAGAVTFDEAKFNGGSVEFLGAQYTGGTVDLSESILPPGGAPPEGLRAVPPPGLKLPAWMMPQRTSPPPVQ